MWILKFNCMGMIYKMSHIILQIIDVMFTHIFGYFEGLNDRIL